MARLAKSQSKASAKGAESQKRSNREAVECSPLVDDEAHESDQDGILVDMADVNAGSDSEGYIATSPISLMIGESSLGQILCQSPLTNIFSELDTAVEFGTPELTPPPDFPLTQRTSIKDTRIARRAQVVPVIDLDSSDEDLESMTVDDSMYRKPAGVKAAALPPSMVTRSKRSNDPSKVEAEEPNKKKYKVDAPVPSAAVAAVGTPFDEAAMALWVSSWLVFMTAFMDKYMKSKAGEHVVPSAPKLPRIDFDQIALDKGLAASRSESKKAEASSSRAKPTRHSPEWDIVKMDADVAHASASDKKDKGKGKLKERSTFATEVEDVFQSAPADAALARSVAKHRARDKTQVESFVIKKKTVALPVSGAALAHEDPTLTIAQYFKENSTVVAADGDFEDAGYSNSEDGEPPSTVFLEDLENYKAFYDPDAPCGVSDPDLQDPALSFTYRKLPPLPGGRQLLAVYDPARGADDANVKGGRAKFSSWRRHLKTMLAKNCIGAMLFVEAAPAFINLSRVSPLRLSKQASAGASATQRLQVDGQIAVCVSAIFCTDSMIVTAGKIGVKSERTRKWIAGIFHNQDWERFESVVCLVFGEDIMYTQINNKKSVSFLTMISPDSAAGAKDTDAQFSKIAPADMFSPVVSTTPTKPRAGTSKVSPTKAKTLLAHNDFLPVFDARKTVVDFSSDLGQLASVLPVFTGEIPFSSFVVVGYSVSAYSAALSGTTQRVPHMGCMFFGPFLDVLCCPLIYLCY
ncbi:hypothetical protein C8F04DRAFT_1258509 [Mycena alexandri]|uniref:Uncharacterized protein n=1 Tax=Mycena alexandri TaxID=1745969 RepID=A0AAD6T0W8_9AGAR|nr:hypothetical protein C8F04DRAFT_1258509 [Mycena alexandri]